MGEPSPVVVVLGGPNGAGKTTVSQSLIAGEIGGTQFINADFIAQGLAGFDSSGVPVTAGRIMLGRLRELAAERESFAFESTLSGIGHATFLKRLKDDGYSISLVYVWVRSASISLRRVRARVRSGGHSVPEVDIRRRFSRSAGNLFRLYMPLADRWIVYDNSSRAGHRLVADGHLGAPPTIHDKRRWLLLQRASHADG